MNLKCTRQMHVSFHFEQHIKELLVLAEASK